MDKYHEDRVTTKIKPDPNLLFPQESRLCSFCRNIFDRWSEVVGKSDVKTGLPHFDDFHALEASARNGCTLCIQFSKCRDAKVNPPETNSGTVSVDFNAHMEPIDTHWNLQITFRFDGHFRLRIDVSVVPVYNHSEHLG